jgi:hypothetical protein
MASSSLAFRALFLGALLCPGVARAEDPSTIEGNHISEGIELIIVGELEVKRRRAEVIKELRELGYGRGERHEDKTVFHHPVAYHPSIVLHDDGIVSIKRGPVRFRPAFGSWSSESTQPLKKLWYLTCIPPLILNCFRVGGQLISPRKLNPLKHRVATRIDPDVDHWRAAMVSNATATRLGVELPAQLEAIWHEGRPVDPRAPILATPAERREAILELWADRACTEEGAAARRIIADHIALEVQHSAHPAPAAELSAAQGAQRCPDAEPLDAPIPSG